MLLCKQLTILLYLWKVRGSNFSLKAQYIYTFSLFATFIEILIENNGY